MTVLTWLKRMLPDVQQQMWQRYQDSGDAAAAGAAVGVSRETAQDWIRARGGVRPRAGALSTVRLSFPERVHIEVGLDRGESLRRIAGRLGRAPSTISREVAQHQTRSGRYVATFAQRQSVAAAARPQPLKLGVEAADAPLRRRVIAELADGRSPRQISARLRTEARPAPADGAEPAEVSHSGQVAAETIYRALYLQARGGLKREVEAELQTRRAAGQTATQTAVLRSGRTARKPRAAARRTTGQGQIPDMISIHQRPPTTHTDGTWLPGHHEGDLILGKNGKSAIGTIVERSTGYLWLLHLPEGHTADQVRAAITAQLQHWPEILKQSITWDRGKEMSQHKQITIDTGLQIYFADPRSPWQRPGNENVNGLLRQYFPKGTDLSIHSQAELERVAAQMNDRPRARFAYAKPIELMTELLLQ